MRVLWLLAFRNWVSNPSRTALVTVSVCLGVAAAMGSLTTVALIEADLRAVAHTAAGPADLEVRALAELGFAVTVTQEVQAIPGVLMVAPLIEKRTFFRHGDQHGFLQVAGIEPAAELAVQGTGLRAGRWPAAGADEIALTQAWASSQGLSIGRELEIVTRDGLRPFQVVGLVARLGADGSPESSDPVLTTERVAFVPLKTAQQAFGMVDRTTHLALKILDTADRDSIVGRLTTTLPGPFAVIDSAPRNDGLQLATQQLVAGLVLFGSTALFVGALVIHNTVSMTVAERRRAIGLLRTAGFLRRQVLLLILIEVLAVAVVGSAAGVLLGTALALGLAVWLEHGQVLAVSRFVVPIEAIGLSLTLGLGTPLVSALIPAWRACCLAPIGAVRVDGPLPGRERSRGWTSALLLVGGGASFLAPLPPALAPLARGLGIMLWLAVMHFGTVALTGPLARFGALPFRWVAGTEGLLAELNLRRAPHRAGLTVVGITVSVALAMVLAELSASAASAGQAQVAALFPEGILLVTAIPQPERLADPFWRQPGVGRVTLLRALSVASGSRWLDAMAIEPAEYFQSTAFPLLDGDRLAALRRLEAGRAVLLPERVARAYGVGRGAMLPLETAAGTVPFEVAGILAYSFPSTDDLGSLVLSRSDAVHDFGAEAFSLLLITPGNGVPLAALVEPLARVAETYGMEAVPVDALRAVVSAGVQHLFLLLGGLLGVGAIVAGLAIATTMLMNATERAPEIAVLRALGLTGSQVQRMLLIEAATLGLVGGLLGVLSGAGLAWMLLRLVQTPDLDLQPGFPILSAGLIVLATMALALVAALWPARRAVRLRLSRPF